MFRIVFDGINLVAAQDVTDASFDTKDEAEEAIKHMLESIPDPMAWVDDTKPIGAVIVEGHDHEKIVLGGGDD